MDYKARRVHWVFEKTGKPVFRPGKTQTRLRSYRNELESKQVTGIILSRQRTAYGVRI